VGVFYRPSQRSNNYELANFTFKSKLHGQWGPDQVGRSVEVGWGFHGVLIGSREFLTLRWAVLEKVLEVGAMRSCPYLVAKPSQVGVEVDGISYPLCCPTAYGCRSGA
jgi:hypothetical protein